jgi:hypothetical protein
MWRGLYDDGDDLAARGVYFVGLAGILYNDRTGGNGDFIVSAA